MPLDGFGPGPGSPALPWSRPGRRFGFTDSREVLGSTEMPPDFLPISNVIGRGGMRARVTCTVLSNIASTKSRHGSSNKVGPSRAFSAASKGRGGERQKVAGSTVSSATVTARGAMRARVACTTITAITARGKVGGKAKTAGSTVSRVGTWWGKHAVLDDFNRANQTPLTAPWATPLKTGNGAINLTGNQLAAAAAVASDAYWNGRLYGPDVALAVTIPTLPTGGASNYVGLWARVTGAGTATPSGYAMLVVPGASAVLVYRVDSGVETLLGTFSCTFIAGDKLGFQLVGSTLYLWHFSGSAWTLRGKVEDSTYTAAGRVGYTTDSATARADDFVAGDSGAVARGAQNQKVSATLLAKIALVRGRGAMRDKVAVTVLAGGAATRGCAGLRARVVVDAAYPMSPARVAARAKVAPSRAFSAAGRGRGAERDKVVAQQNLGRLVVTKGRGASKARVTVLGPFGGTARMGGKSRVLVVQKTVVDAPSTARMASRARVVVVESVPGTDAYATGRGGVKTRVQSNVLTDIASKGRGAAKWSSPATTKVLAAATGRAGSKTRVFAPSGVNAAVTARGASRARVACTVITAITATSRSWANTPANAYILTDVAARGRAAMRAKVPGYVLSPVPTTGRAGSRTRVQVVTVVEVNATAIGRTQSVSRVDVFVHGILFSGGNSACRSYATVTVASNVQTTPIRMHTSGLIVKTGFGEHPNVIRAASVSGSRGVAQAVHGRPGLYVAVAKRSGPKYGVTRT